MSETEPRRVHTSELIWLLFAEFFWAAVSTCVTWGEQQLPQIVVSSLGKSVFRAWLQVSSKAM
jgi:hypothetical protein